MTIILGFALYLIVLCIVSWLSEKYTPVVGIGGFMLLLALLKFLN